MEGHDQDDKKEGPVATIPATLFTLLEQYHGREIVKE